MGDCLLAEVALGREPGELFDYDNILLHFSPCVNTYHHLLGWRCGFASNKLEESGAHLQHCPDKFGVGFKTLRVGHC